MSQEAFGEVTPQLVRAFETRLRNRRFGMRTMWRACTRHRSNPGTPNDRENSELPGTSSQTTSHCTGSRTLFLSRLPLNSCPPRPSCVSFVVMPSQNDLNSRAADLPARRPARCRRPVVDITSQTATDSDSVFHPLPASDAGSHTCGTPLKRSMLDYWQRQITIHKLHRTAFDG